MPASVPLLKVINLRQLVFEVTTHCNLNCTYCGYGPFYNMRTHQDRMQMPFAVAKTLLNYLFNLWAKYKNDYDVRETIIGFYGGEPLLNFDLIKSVISFIEEHSIKNRQFGYSMTTNAVLLDRYMDYLAEKKFRLLISLDGDKIAHSYRIDKNGTNSFERVIENVKKLREKHPVYFEKYVAFNSVLTDRGSLLGIKNFILKEFQKNPMVAEVNNFGVRESQKKAFDIIYKSIDKEISEPKCSHFLNELDFTRNPRNKIAYRILERLGDNSFSAYNSLFLQKEGAVFPTGTCFPFDKKMFVTVKGDILPCERINQRLNLGHVSENKVYLDFEDIARKYSNYYEKVFKTCKGCFAKPICEQCMFHINDLDTNPRCPNYLNKQQYENLVNSYLTYLSENPQLYSRMMKEMF